MSCDGVYVGNIHLDASLAGQQLLATQTDREVAVNQQKLYDQQVGAIQPVSQMVDTVALQKDIRNFHSHPASTTRWREVYKQR